MIFPYCCMGRKVPQHTAKYCICIAPSRNLSLSSNFDFCYTAELRQGNSRPPDGIEKMRLPNDPKSRFIMTTVRSFFYQFVLISVVFVFGAEAQKPTPTPDDTG